MHATVRPLLLLLASVSICEVAAQQITPIPSQPASPAAAPVLVPPADPAPPVEPAVVPATAPPVVTHTIVAGDNPWSIAKNYGVKLEDLLKVNNIKDPKNLTVGDVLKLPEGADKKSGSAPVAGKVPAQSPAPPVAATSPAPEGGDWEYYTIQKGDNPWKIAKSRKVDHQKIVSLNEGVDFTKLMIGQQIKVPKAQ